MPREEFDEHVRAAAQSAIHEGAWKQWAVHFMQWLRHDFEADKAKGAWGDTFSDLDKYIADEVFTKDTFDLYLNAYQQIGPSLVQSMDAHAKFGDLKHGGGFLSTGSRTLEDRKPFRQWLMDENDDPKVMNCWEVVLYAAYQATFIDFVDKTYITHAVYRQQADEAPALVKSILSSPAGQVVRNRETTDSDVHNPKGNHVDFGRERRDGLTIDPAVHIPEGYIVIFGSAGEHVAVSTGKLEPISDRDVCNRLNRTLSHGIYELDHETKGVERSTIDEAIWRKPQTYGNQVTWGPLPVMMLNAVEKIGKGKSPAQEKM